MRERRSHEPAGSRALELAHLGAVVVAVAAIRPTTGCRPAMATRRACCRWLAHAAIVLAVHLPATDAAAYRTFADDPNIAYPARWPSDDIAWDVASTNLATPDSQMLAEAGRTAFSTWESSGCMPFSGRFGGIRDAPATANDGRNTISFVIAGWRTLGFESGRAAFTDVRLAPTAAGTVEIVEADIYINAEDYAFVVDASPAEGELSLGSVLVHEVGHLLGLLHPCEHSVAGIPECAHTTDSTASVLYPDYRSANVMLSSDDREGICQLYARSGECTPECTDGLVCADGRCIRSDCPDGGCGEPCDGGVCESANCETDDACSAGVCGVASDVEGLCTEAGSVGAPCATGRDCATRFCVSSMSFPGFCTVECTEDAACPAAQRCTRVAGRNVCAPASETSGCSAHGHPHRNAGAIPLPLSFIAASCGLWLMRRRSSI